MAGAWFPLVIGIGMFTLMLTWKQGRKLMSDRLRDEAIGLDDFLESIFISPPLRVPGTAVFLSADTGLWLILGWLLETRHLVFSRVAVVAMPAFISAVLWWFDPEMARYGGLSAVNLGLLLFPGSEGPVPHLVVCFGDAQKAAEGEWQQQDFHHDSGLTGSSTSSGHMQVDTAGGDAGGGHEKRRTLRAAFDGNGFGSIRAKRIVRI